MSPLETYIERQNAWRKMFPSVTVPLKMPTTAREAEGIIGQIEDDLSPENLCCDGEISGDRLRDKSTRLNNAYNEAVNLKLRFERREKYE